MKRVLVDSAGLRVSKAGFDVTVATPAQMSMDTRATKFLSVIYQGTVNISAFTVDTFSFINTAQGPKEDTTSHFDVTFAAALPAPPIMLMSVQDPLLTDAAAVTNSFSFGTFITTWWGDSGGVGATSIGGTVSLRYTVTTTGFTIFFEYHSLGYVIPPHPTFINYSVLRTL